MEEMIKSTDLTWQEDLVSFAMNLQKQELQFIASQEYAKVYGRQMAKEAFSAPKAVAKTLEKARLAAVKAKRDVPFLVEHWQNLCGLLDLATANYNKASKGGADQMKFQKQIMALNKQLHTTETQIANAKKAIRQYKKLKEEAA